MTKILVLLYMRLKINLQFFQKKKETFITMYLRRKIRNVF